MYISLCQLLLQAKNPFVLVKPNDDCSSNPSPDLRDPRDLVLSSSWWPLISGSSFLSPCPILWVRPCVSVSSPKSFLEGSRAQMVSHPVSFQSQSSESHQRPEGRASLTSIHLSLQHRDHHPQLPAGLIFSARDFRVIGGAPGKQTLHPYIL